MDYLLDTNIIVIYSRDNDIAKSIEKKYELFSGKHDLYISVVTLGELDSFIKKNKIGVRKQEKISRMLAAINKIGIEYGELISLYGDIDAYSQGKLVRDGNKTNPKNMGKNDVWIAATASHYGLKLITTDKDFQHLNDIFVDLELIDIIEMKK